MVSLGMASPVQGRWSLSTGGVIGRVGALAVALGVGSVIASMPVASADTTGSAGAAGAAASDSSAPAKAGPRGARGAASAASAGSAVRGAGVARAKNRGVRPDVVVPAGVSVGVKVAATGVSPHLDVLSESSSATADPVSPVFSPAPDVPVISALPQAASAGSASGVGANVLSWLGSDGSDGGSPVASPLEWAAVAVTRRELGVASPTAPVASARAAATAATAAATWQPGSVLRIFVGNGTADNPNAGILAGDGFSYDATSCLSLIHI